MARSAKTLTTCVLACTAAAAMAYGAQACTRVLWNNNDFAVWWAVRWIGRNRPNRS